jgi:outer membrane receptor protein involved in Fe transport
MNCSPKKWQQSFVLMLAIAMVVFLGSANGAYGQSYATITGRAVDPKGATVPNATVTAANTETGLVRTTTTTSDGLYRFENLAPGIYDVTIEAGSFTKEVVKAVKLQVGEARDVNFTLELSTQKESVLVTSEIPLVETTKTDISTNLDDRDLANLPVTTPFAGISGVANDWQGMAYSAPGVRTDYTGNLGNEIVGPGSVNDRGVLHNVDGGDISDVSTSARDSLGATLEEVKEFQVITNNYNAEYGQAGSLILNVITKSGTNSIHGDGHAYFRGRNMGASDFFYNQGLAANTLASPGFCPLSDFNATTGALTTVQGCGRAQFYKHEYGFTAGGPFVKDRLFWFTSLEQVQQGQPQITTPFGQAITVNSPTTEILWSAKVDAKLTDKHTLTTRFNVQRDLQDNLIVQTGSATDPSGFVSSFNHDHTLNVAMVSTPTLHTVNEARFFWHWERSGTPDKSNAPGQNLPTAYVGADFCCPQAGLNNRFQYIDNFSWTRGSHTLKAGALVQHLSFDSLFTQFRNGEYDNFGPGACVNQPYGLCPSSFTVGVGAAFNHIADTAYGLYAQDTWQIKRNVTINYGLRYDIEVGAFTGGTINRVQNPGVSQTGCLQRNNIIPACGSDHNNWQPRLGIAWSPNFDHGFLHTLFGDPGKSVVRIAGAEITELAYLNVVLDSLNFDGVSLNTASVGPTTKGSDGSPLGQIILNQVYPNFPSQTQLQLLLPIGFFGRIRPVSPTIKNPEIRNASLSITRQVGRSFVYSVGYLGVFANGLFGETDENFPKPVADPAHAGFFYFPTPALVDPTIPGDGRPDNRFGAVRTNFSNRTSSYNALMVTTTKRLSHHFQFGANYTYSKTLGTGEDFYGLSEPGNPLANLKLDRAPVQNDLRHLANFSFVADTEKLTGMRFVQNVVNNWTFAFIGTVQSGRPYPVSSGSGAIVGSKFPGIGSESNQRPNICTAGSTIPGCAGAPVGALVATNIASYSGSNRAISEAGVAACQAAGQTNCAALQTTFLAPAGANPFGPSDSYSGDPVDFQFLNGNLARNAGLTKGLTNFDISLLKAFRVPKRESMRVELKLDVFNIFNHPNFISNNSFDNISALHLPKLKTKAGAPNPSFNCTASCVNPFSGLYLGADGTPLTLGVFTSGRPDKDLQNPNFGGLGDPASDVQNRVMQLAIRIRF